MNTNALRTQNQLTTWLQRRTPSNGVRRIYSILAAVSSDIGNIREENQDRAAVARGRDHEGREYVLAAVADGIGGMNDGGICASIAVSTLIATIDQLAQRSDVTSNPGYWLREGAYAANKAIFSKLQANGGSTLVALLVRAGEHPYWLSIGDSRVYCANSKTLIQVSIDDTIAGQLGKNPDESSEQSRLLQFVGMGPDLEPHIDKIDDNQIDTVLLTTDGVHFLSSAPGWLSQILRHAPDPGVCVKRLVDLAKWCGGPDNATVALLTLPIQLQDDAKVDYPYLEVWDAYGELQIITTPIADQLTNTENLIHSNQKKPAQKTKKISNPETPIDNENLCENMATPKARRSRTNRKPKKEKGEKAADVIKIDEADRPQLRMEFPTKPNE